MMIRIVFPTPARKPLASSSEASRLALTAARFMARRYALEPLSASAAATGLSCWEAALLNLWHVLSCAQFLTYGYYPVWFWWDRERRQSDRCCACVYTCAAEQQSNVIIYHFRPGMERHSIIVGRPRLVEIQADVVLNVGQRVASHDVEWSRGEVGGRADVEAGYHFWHPARSGCLEREIRIDYEKPYVGGQQGGQGLSEVLV